MSFDSEGVFLLRPPSDSFFVTGLQWKHESIHFGAIAFTEDSDQEKFRVFCEDVRDWVRTNPKREQVLAYFQSNPNIPSGFLCIARIGTLALCAATQGSVLLFREGNSKEIVKGNGKLFFVEGSVAENDTFLLASDPFLNRYANSMYAWVNPWESLQQILKNFQDQSDAHEAAFALTVQTQITNTTLPVVSKDHKRQRTRTYIQPWSLLIRRYQKMLRLLILLVLSVLLLFFGGVFFSSRRTARIEATIAPYEQRLESALSLQASARSTSEKQLASLLTDIGNVEQTYGADTAVHVAVSQLKQKVTQAYQDVSKSRLIDRLSVFYDFRLVRPDISLHSIAFDEVSKMFVFLDTQHAQLVTLTLEKKLPHTIALPSEIGTPRALSVQNGSASIVGQHGLYTVQLPISNQGKVMTFPEVGDDDIFAATYKDTLYLLDIARQSFVRRSLNEQASSPSAWLRPGTHVDFDTVRSFTVDGDVWMGFSDGSIGRYASGVRRTFSLSDIAQAPIDTVLLYTSETTKQLYVLEPKGERLLVFSKDGTYLSALKSPDFAAASGFVVQEQVGKAYVLAGSILYEVSF